VSAIDNVVYFDGDEVVPCKCRFVFKINSYLNILHI